MKRAIKYLGSFICLQTVPSTMMRRSSVPFHNRQHWLLRSLLLIAMTAATKMKMSSAFRIVSYNVLSPNLASPKYFTALDPLDLDSSTRYTRICDKLEQQMQGNEKSVFCLQEVSYEWAGQLHAFFGKHGYHVRRSRRGRTTVYLLLRVSFVVLLFCCFV